VGSGPGLGLFVLVGGGTQVTTVEHDHPPRPGLSALRWLGVHSAAQKRVGGSRVAWPRTSTADQQVAQAGTKYTESWSASMMSASLDLRTAKSSEGRQGNTLR
jgi:hypothetical protein